jgi:hypothetical protein
VAVHSEYLTGSIEEVSADTGMSQVRKCGVWSVLEHSCVRISFFISLNIWKE